MGEESAFWVVIVRGKAEGKETRVALDFQDARDLLSPSEYIIGSSFIDQLLELINQYDHWVIRTIIDQVFTPDKILLPATIPYFVILSRSRSRGLSAGALFLAQNDFSTATAAPLSEDTEPSNDLLGKAKRYQLVGISPMGFAAACSEDSRLFVRFITRLLKRPHSFSDLSLLLHRSIGKRVQAK